MSERLTTRTVPLNFALGHCGEIDPSCIAYWVHCECGMTTTEFVRWLLGELALLDAIDPECSK
jgi:hypothetical protein